MYTLSILVYHIPDSADFMPKISDHSPLHPIFRTIMNLKRDHCIATSIAQILRSVSNSHSCSLYLSISLVFSDVINTIVALLKTSRKLRIWMCVYYWNVPFSLVFCSWNKLFLSLELKIDVRSYFDFGKKNKRFLVLYVSLSYVELDFVHLSLTLQVQTFTSKFFLLTYMLYDMAKENLALHQDSSLLMTCRPNPIWYGMVKLWTWSVKKSAENKRKHLP